MKEFFGKIEIFNEPTILFAICGGCIVIDKLYSYLRVVKKRKRNVSAFTNILIDCITFWVLSRLFNEY